MRNDNPLVLMILDGWGYREDSTYNAIAAANTPQWNEWWSKCPHTLLDASGAAVGLPNKQMGNSEVGHMHIGAGRVIEQDFTRINAAIKIGTFAQNPVLLELLADLKQENKRLHIMGLLSAGGVHSHENHLFAFLALCAQHHVNNICLHLFLDGRDTPPQSALHSLAKLKQELIKYPVATICSITGRYFAMDRDQRWERIAPVYHLLVTGSSHFKFASPEEAINSFYAEKTFDEFIPPTVIGEYAPIEDGDSIFLFNFRADRVLQLTQALSADTFTNFIRPRQPSIKHFVSMTRYSKHLPTKSVFPPNILSNTLGEVLAKSGLTQLRLAETEKYAHVTFFFNGGAEAAFPNEDRILVPSPSIATYDLSPAMSAPDVTRTLIEAIHSNAYDVIICNYANADMVAHTGDLGATVQAIECLDTCMRQVWEALAPKQGILIITADHGNAEFMFDEITGQPHTAHTSQLVPFLVIGSQAQCTVTHGCLTDIAPTVLALLDIPQPKEMTGKVLLK